VFHSKGVVLPWRPMRNCWLQAGELTGGTVRVKEMTNAR